MISFAASKLPVFRAIAPVAFIVLAASSAAAASDAERSELRGPTVQAWMAYERLVDSRLRAAPPVGAPFFALDAYGVDGWKKAALAGGVAMRRLERPQPGGAAVDVPEGKIHHWAGAVFVPGQTVEGVLQHLSTYAGRESEHYADVLASRLISRSGDAHKVFLKLRRTKIVTVTYNTEHAVEYRRLGASRATARSVSTRIAELADAGTAKEREKPEGQDQGFLWRLNAYWRYEAVDGGVLIECESISLSRNVPAFLNLFIRGIVEGIARDSLQRTLTGLKGALLKTT
jgi:hypothetical protein